MNCGTCEKLQNFFINIQGCTGSKHMKIVLNSAQSTQDFMILRNFQCKCVYVILVLALKVNTVLQPILQKEYVYDKQNDHL